MSNLNIPGPLATGRLEMMAFRHMARILIAVFAVLALPGLCLGGSYVLPGGVARATDASHCSALDKEWAIPIKQVGIEHDLCLKSPACRRSGATSGMKCTCSACEELHNASGKFSKMRDAQMKSCHAQVDAFNKLLADQRAETARQVREQAELKRESERAQAERIRAAQQKADELKQDEARIRQKQEAEMAESRRSQESFRISQSSPPSAPQRGASPAPVSGSGSPRPPDRPSPPAIVNSVVETARNISRGRDELNDFRNRVDQINRGMNLERARDDFVEARARNIEDRARDLLSRTLRPGGLSGEVSNGGDEGFTQSRRDIENITSRGVANPLIREYERVIGKVGEDQQDNTLRELDRFTQSVDANMADASDTEGSPFAGSSPSSRVAGGSSGGSSSPITRRGPGAPVAGGRIDPSRSEQEVAERKRRAEPKAFDAQTIALNDLVALVDSASKQQKPAPRGGSVDHANRCSGAECSDGVREGTVIRAPGDGLASGSPVSRDPAGGVERPNSPTASLPMSEAPGARQSSDLSSLLAMVDDANKQQKQAFRNALDRADRCPDFRCADAALKEAAKFQNDFDDKRALAEGRKRANARADASAGGN